MVFERHAFGPRVLRSTSSEKLQRCTSCLWLIEKVRRHRNGASSLSRAAQRIPACTRVLQLEKDERANIHVPSHVVKKNARQSDTFASELIGVVEIPAGAVFMRHQMAQLVLGT